MKDKLNIWLADLFHDKVSPYDVVPLNLGYLAAHTSRFAAGDVSIKLFKYPETLSRELHRSAPDVLAFSNYTWNAELALFFAQLAKKISPRIFTVIGGPNVPIEADRAHQFLCERPYIDCYIPLEGEVPFTKLIMSFLDAGRCGSPASHLQDAGLVPGCLLNLPEYHFEPVPSDQNNPFEEYTSCYCSGWLDPFIRDPRLTPLFETNRGCPYGCTFCAWGMAALSRVKRKDPDDVIAEFNYVAENSVGQAEWMFADANFGMFPVDVRYAEAITGIQGSRGIPRRLNMNWAKTSTAHTRQAMKLLQDMVPAQLAVQSFDPIVVGNLGRKNCDEAFVREFVTDMHNQGSTVFTDILIGCAGESAKSHLGTLRQALEYDFDVLSINNIRVLPSTLVAAEEYQERYGIQTMFRFVPNSYGMYENTFIFEAEEAVMSTDAMSKDEMVWLRKIHFLIYLLWSSGFARLPLRYAMVCGTNPVDIFCKIEEDCQTELFKSVLDPLAKEYSEEWFETLADLRKHYANADRQRLLVEGRNHSEKLMWKYIAKCICSERIIVSSLEQVVDILCRDKAVDCAVLDVLMKMSRDRLLLRLGNRHPGKRKRSFASTPELCKSLMSMNMLHEGAAASEGKTITVSYIYTEEVQTAFTQVLQRYDINADPERAVCALLNNGLLVDFVYDLGLSLDD